jgi:hypothetical protein
MSQPSTEPWPVDTRSASGEPVALVDLLDRLLGGGVVLSADLTLCLAGVDLVHLSLAALVTSASGGVALAPVEPRPTQPLPNELQPSEPGPPW